MKIGKYFNTIIHLKFIQLFYQLVYRLRSKTVLKSRGFVYDVVCVDFGYRIPQYGKYLGNNSFQFLNLEKDFKERIDWDFSEYGKLWIYNLEYFDYLNQDNIHNDEKIRLIHDFYSFSIDNKRILEPYPVSLRSINIIKFLSLTKIKDERIINCLHQELTYLSRNLEFHILGNHLLENLFALLLGGFYFRDASWIKVAEKNLRVQLGEQILDDGAHFELSPMYHQIILYRLLELIDWYSKQQDKDHAFFDFCVRKCRSMLGWLKAISFKNGDIPLFKDSAKGIANSSQDLFDFAKFLYLDFDVENLSKSGYRSFQSKTFEIKMNFAQVGASYQPGHAHADALSFILYFNNKPIFVEQGTSTYQIGARRNLERSTEAHNTVVVDNISQSEVWGGFRVGRRAKSFILEEENNKFVGYHTGYKRRGTIHQRTFELSDNLVSIKDSLTNKKSGVAYFHLAPELVLIPKNNYTFLVEDHCVLEFTQADDIILEKYLYANSYNVYNESQRLKVSFTSELKTSINFIK
ncbi:alginate lyase family protein [Sphingobacterium composti Ten et al. 2007 non Yoo et al. 2007]|uniref:alginate lyase family protein n=1 Tax=Sphingobacterium composti TaxID=363260 RepID=UPI001357CA92|nr:alginate lyase family protein [Sphingobacterium composti Ten et al. 2007 non Yoo et al. 2007]